MPASSTKNPAAPKRRVPVRAIVIVAIVVLAVGGIAAAVAWNWYCENSIFVLKTATYYEDDVAYTTTYTLDENGSVVLSSTDDGSGDTTYEVDENGFYTLRTYTYESEDEDTGETETVTVTETRTIEETDDEGRPTLISSVTEYSNQEYVLYSTITYTYRDNGMLKSMTTAIYGGYTTTVTFNSKGFMSSYELTWEEVTSSERLYEYEYEYEGSQITGGIIYNQDDEYGSLEFEYDGNGNLVTYSANGSVLYEYTYVRVLNPSVAAQLASELCATTPVL